jgi:hypothetical protein
MKDTSVIKHNNGKKLIVYLPDASTCDEFTILTHKDKDMVYQYLEEDNTDHMLLRISFKSTIDMLMELFALGEEIIHTTLFKNTCKFLKKTAIPYSFLKAKTSASHTHHVNHFGSWICDACDNN